MLENDARGQAQRVRLHEHLLLAARRRRAVRGDARAPPPTDPDINVRAFECLGACDIAPMASVDGVYVGPLERRGRRAACSRTCAPAGRCCPRSSSRRRLVADPRANGREFPLHPAAPSRRGGAAHEHPVEPMLLFNDIDEPGLNTLPVYEAARRLRVAAQGAGDDARGGARRARSLPAARPRRRRLRDGHEGLVPAEGRASTSTWSATRTSPSPGTFKDRELMQKTPHTLIEGIVIAAYARGRSSRSFIYIRGEYVQQADVARRRDRRSARGRLPRRAHPRLRALADARRCTAAPAPTSAARRPACSTRSKASAATRA